MILKSPRAIDEWLGGLTESHFLSSLVVRLWALGVLGSILHLLHLWLLTSHVLWKYPGFLGWGISLYDLFMNHDSLSDGHSWADSSLSGQLLGGETL